MTLQRLTLTLDGITAGDYLQWVRDPEPPALGLGLSSMEVRGEPLGDTVEAALWWDVPPPATVDAGPAAGLPLTPEVVAVRIDNHAATPGAWRKAGAIPALVVRADAAGDEAADDRVAGR